MQTRSCLKRKT